jgi:hypothetical protein
LGRAERGEGGGKAEGSGGFIGAALVAIQRVGNARGNYSGDVTGRGREGGGNGGDDRWVPPVGEGKRVSWVPVRELARWAAGWLLLWAESFPWSPKRFYFFLLLFSFFWKTDLSFENALLFIFD